MRAIAFAALLVLLPPALAHGTFEANELETHLLNDEGTDTMQEYGGYDINELFLGVAHDPALGEGATGDGLYFRLEAYGEFRPGATSEPWRLVFHFTTTKGPQERSISTADGAAFTSDFDALAVRAEGVELHVDRAFLRFASLGIEAGSTVTAFSVESLVGDDLRDVAPGPLCVPFTGCQATYDDPLAIPGQGALATNLTLPSPAIYLGAPRVTGTAFSYRVEVPSALRNGGQHVMLRVAGPSAGWNHSVSPAVAVEPNATATFQLEARPDGAAADLALELTTDVGGRLPLTVARDGTVLVAGATAFEPPAPEPEKSPAAGVLLALAALALAGVRRTASR